MLASGTESGSLRLLALAGGYQPPVLKIGWMQRPDLNKTPFGGLCHWSWQVHQKEVAKVGAKAVLGACKELAMGQNPVHPNPHQNRLKWVVHLPQNGTIGFDPQPTGDFPFGLPLRHAKTA